MLATSPVEFEAQDVLTLPLPLPAPQVRWRLGTRLAFRFTLLYFTLYVISTQMISSLLQFPNLGVPGLESFAAVQRAVTWIARHILRVQYTFSFQQTGSGDRTADYALAFTLLLAAAIGTAAWSAVDRRRGNYARLNAWFRVFLSLSLAATMVTYGTIKAIPVQMPYPSLNRLLEPYGHFSPMGVIWYSIGASRPYEIFTGCVELTAAILLFVPRLRVLGALIALATSIQVFALNMTYDVPVKLFSFHLIVMALVLLAPEASRLADFFLFNRAAPPPNEAPLFRRRRAATIAAAVQIALGAYLVGLGFYSSWQGWTRYGGGAPKSALYGIWNVERMSVDGVIRSPLINDYGRWRRVVFDRPTALSFQRMDDTFAGYGATIDVAAKTIALTKGADRNWKAQFAYQQPDAERLILEGQMDGQRIRLETRLFDRNTFLLVTSGFRWVQEFPFNR